MERRALTESDPDGYTGRESQSSESSALSPWWITIAGRWKDISFSRLDVLQQPNIAHINAFAELRLQ